MGKTGWRIFIRKTYRHRAAWLCAFALFFVLASRANALIRGRNPPSFQSHTVEAITADSPLILTATVVSSGVARWEWEATFATGEILKCPPGYVAVPKLDVSLDFFLTSYHYIAGDERQFQFPPIGSRVLLFLSNDGSLYDCVLLDAPGPARSLISPQALDLTLTNIKDNQSLLSNVKIELRRVPPISATKSFFVYPYSLDTLPDDDRIVPAAHRWVRSSDPYGRLIGARVLGQFPDPQDIPTLKSLLDDPSLSDYPILSPWSGRSHLVRLAAWEALQAQHVILPLPAIDMPRTGTYQPVSWLWPTLFLLGPWIPYAAWRAIRNRRGSKPRFRRRLTNALTSACLIYAVAATPFWQRSMRTADSVVWAGEGLIFTLDSIQGNFFIELGHAWPAAAPLVRASVTPNAEESDPIKRGDIFWHGFGCWDYASLWSAYVWDRRDIPRFLGAEITDNHFPFPLGRASPYPPSKAIIVGCSYLYLILLLLSFPVLRVVLFVARRFYRNWQAARAARRGLCPKCSYDLRAHSPGDRCPECGTVIPSGHPICST